MRQMNSSRASRSSRFVVAIATAAVAASLGAGAVFAGEITGNGTLKTVHGRSECAYSGQEDLQFYVDDGDTVLKPVPTRGDPGHAQSWGQLPKEVRDYLTSIGLNPGIACNPTRSSGEG
jgi:hypothetical protein